MATSTANTLIGAGTVSIGDWVTAGGAGSLTDVGHTNAPIDVTHAFEDHETKSERAKGTIKRTPMDMTVTVKVPMLEATLEHWRILSRQAAANLTGTPPDLTLRVGQPVAQYHQMTIVGPGLGSGSVRTVTLWRAIVMEVGPIQFAKGGDMVFDVTFGILEDDTLGTADTFYKVVDS